MRGTFLRVPPALCVSRPSLPPPLMRHPPRVATRRGLHCPIELLAPALRHLGRRRRKTTSHKTHRALRVRVRHGRHQGSRRRQQAQQGGRIRGSARLCVYEQGLGAVREREQERARGTKSMACRPHHQKTHAPVPPRSARPSPPGRKRCAAGPGSRPQRSRAHCR